MNRDDEHRRRLMRTDLYPKLSAEAKTRLLGSLKAQQDMESQRDEAKGKPRGSTR